ncbi:MAG: polysaccharide deacetylase family protein [Myxococcales bacterium]|nr:polysaccharide deacetylase family protein [Myxococcales bacterium]
MSQRWKRALLRTAGGLGLARAAHPIWGRSVNVLMYHYFEGSADDELVVPPTALRAQLRELRARYRLVGLTSAMDALFRGDDLSRRRCVAISIDDVGDDFVRVAWPVFRDLGVPVTLAVCPGFAEDDEHAMLFGALHAHVRIAPGFANALAALLGRDGLAYADCFDALFHRSTTELADIAAAMRVPHPMREPRDLPGGLRLPVARFDALRQIVEESHGLVEIGSHTMTHPVLSLIGGDWLRWEIETSRERIARTFGACDLLFYPGGALPPARELDAEGLLKAGYRHAFTASAGLASERSDPFRIGRVAVLGGEGLGAFRTRAAAWPAVMRRARAPIPATN